jgi:hypothetical protein
LLLVQTRQRRPEALYRKSVQPTSLAYGAQSSAPGPEALYQALSSAPFADSELPAGYARPTISGADPAVLASTPGLLGLVLVQLPGPAGTDLMTYAVYHTEAQAEAYFAAAQPSAGIDVVERFVPAGFDYPIHCYVAAFRHQEIRYYETVVCVSLVGSVTVSAAHTKRGDTDDALFLVRSGVAHLERVRREAASSGPAAYLSPE